jgi:hypothetical protein
MYRFTIATHPRDTLSLAIRRAEDWLDRLGRQYTRLYYTGVDFVDINTAIHTFEVPDE